MADVDCYGAPLVMAAFTGNKEKMIELLTEDEQFDEEGILANYKNSNGIPLFTASLHLISL